LGEKCLSIKFEKAIKIGNKKKKKKTKLSKFFNSI
jgi:undecaprenyl pyrophosphate synthase